MPIAITVGALFHSFFSEFTFLTPYLIFVMLFLTYCKMQWKNIQLTKLHLWLILIQILGSVAVYFIIAPFNKILAQGVMVCIIAPTGTAAPVITGMLKGNVESLTAYSLLINICVAIFTPLIFSFAGEANTLSFAMGVLNISKSVFSVILIPLAIAFVLKLISPKITQTIGKYSMLSFILWTISLAIVSGKTVSFIIAQNSGNYFTEIALAIGALLVCIALFTIGKTLGSKYNDRMAAGQSLGQKNTILAIWMSQTYLNPLSSIAPGMYVLWQNLFNSWQIWKESKKNNLSE